MAKLPPFFLIWTLGKSSDVVPSGARASEAQLLWDLLALLRGRFSFCLLFEGFLSAFISLPLGVPGGRAQFATCGGCSWGRAVAQGGLWWWRPWKPKPNTLLFRCLLLVFFVLFSFFSFFFLPEHYRLLWSSPTDHITCIFGVQNSIFPWQHLWILIPKQRLNSSTPRRIDNRISLTCNVQFSLLFRNSTNLSTTPWVFITSSIGGFGSETARQCQRANRPRAGE